MGIKNNNKNWMLKRKKENSLGDPWMESKKDSRGIYRTIK
jgi:hypothetical protein